MKNELFIYEFHNDQVTIIKYIGDQEDVVIPAEIEGKPVTVIGKRAFADCSFLKSVIIPEGVKVIRHGAFNSTPALTYVEIPESVTCIQDRAFIGYDPVVEVLLSADKKYLLNVHQNFKGTLVIPEGVKVLCPQVATGSKYLRHIEMPESLEVIGDYAFSSCESLISVNIPKGIKKIGNYAFFLCTHYRNLLLSTSGEYLLEAGDGIKDKFTIPDGIKVIAPQACCRCYNLKTIEFPESLTVIGNYAFFQCSYLTSVEIPSGVTTIGNGAFRKCEQLKSIVIPESVTNIGRWVFANCENLTIHAPKGSKAAEYARRNEFRLEFID